MAPRSQLLAIAFALSSLVVSQAKNISIDDTEDAWSFEPVSYFGSVSTAAPCNECTSQPDSRQAFHGTWRDCVKRGTATLTFEGVGVTVYTICPGTSIQAHTKSPPSRSNIQVHIRAGYMLDTTRSRLMEWPRKSGKSKPVSPRS